MNASTATYDDSYLDDRPSSTASVKRRLIDLVTDTVGSEKWPRNILPDLVNFPTAFKLEETEPQIKNAATEINPEQNLRIEKNLIDWLEALSRVDDDSDAQEELLSEIRSLSVFQRGWDGEGAEPIAQESIDSAVSYIENYETDLQFDAYPDPDGTVGLRADLANGRILLSFSKNGTVAYLIKNRKVVHRGYGADHSTIQKLLATLI